MVSIIELITTESIMLLTIIRLKGLWPTLYFSLSHVCHVCRIRQLNNNINKLNQTCQKAICTDLPRMFSNMFHEFPLFIKYCRAAFDRTCKHVFFLFEFQWNFRHLRSKLTSSAILEHACAMWAHHQITTSFKYVCNEFDFFISQYFFWVGNSPIWNYYFNNDPYYILCKKHNVYAKLTFLIVKNSDQRSTFF